MMKRKNLTYCTWDSLVVTDPTTSQAICLHVYDYGSGKDRKRVF